MRGDFSGTKGTQTLRSAREVSRNFVVVVVATVAVAVVAVCVVVAVVVVVVVAAVVVVIVDATRGKPERQLTIAWFETQVSQVCAHTGVHRIRAAGYEGGPSDRRVRAIWASPHNRTYAEHSSLKLKRLNIAGRSVPAVLFAGQSARAAGGSEARAGPPRDTPQGPDIRNRSPAKGSEQAGREANLATPPTAHAPTT